MELIVKVDDREAPFVLELLRKFSFVREVSSRAVPEPLVETAAAESLWKQAGQSLFETRADFDGWLMAPNIWLANRLPALLLADEGGYESVRQLLGRMQHGVMA